MARGPRGEGGRRAAVAAAHAASSPLLWHVARSLPERLCHGPAGWWLRPGARGLGRKCSGTQSPPRCPPAASANLRWLNRDQPAAAGSVLTRAADHCPRSCLLLTCSCPEAKSEAPERSHPGDGRPVCPLPLWVYGSRATSDIWSSVFNLRFQWRPLLGLPASSVI